MMEPGDALRLRIEKIIVAIVTEADMKANINWSLMYPASVVNIVTNRVMPCIFQSCSYITLQTLTAAKEVRNMCIKYAQESCALARGTRGEGDAQPSTSICTA